LLCFDDAAFAARDAAKNGIGLSSQLNGRLTD